MLYQMGNQAELFSKCCTWYDIDLIKPLRLKWEYDGDLGSSDDVAND